MILRSITMEDFGLYQGSQTIDLIPERGRPVVLFGGRNGAGKTTLLEAVRLALYGKRALGVRIGKAEYEEHLLGRIHVGADGRRASGARISLEFDYAEGGRVHRYEVKRTWSADGEKIDETLALSKDGAQVVEVPREEWQSFLQELIPPGVSQLFFFDGEKIAEIARDNPDEALADAIRGLLGIELVGRLRTDIGLYLARRARGKGDAAAERLKAAVDELVALDRAIDELNDDTADAVGRAKALAAKAEGIRGQFISEGGDAARRRGDLEGSRKELADQISRMETELRELMSTSLPLAMAPNLLRRFDQAISNASNAGAAREAEALRERLLGWRAANEPRRDASWSEKHWRDLDGFLASEARTSLEIGSNLSSIDASERRRYAEVLNSALGQTPARAAVLVEELDALGQRLSQVDAELQRASGKAAEVLLEDLLQVERDVALAEAQAKAKEEELRSLRHKRDNLERERKRALDAQNEAVATEERAALAGRVGKALKQYEDRLLSLKIEQLRSEFVSRFNHLARKVDFIADVRIDPRNFETVLIDRSGTEIRKSSLSAGEKQIYAVAMLWALARTSGRALPMIIDTPLARLDTEHRQAIVERYFPEASHQVIILSTDTEIDDRLLDGLGPSVSHSFRLDYRPEAKATSVSPGYFWDTKEEGRDAVQQA